MSYVPVTVNVSGNFVITVFHVGSYEVVGTEPVCILPKIEIVRYGTPFTAIGSLVLQQMQVLEDRHQPLEILNLGGDLLFAIVQCSPLMPKGRPYVERRLADFHN